VLTVIIEGFCSSGGSMEIPDFVAIYEWLRSAEVMSSARRGRKAQRVSALREVIQEPHRFVVVLMPDPEDMIGAGGG
jgi:hypothetical protein